MLALSVEIHDTGTVIRCSDPVWQMTITTGGQIAGSVGNSNMDRLEFPFFEDNISKVIMLEMPHEFNPSALRQAIVAAAQHIRSRSGDMEDTVPQETQLGPTRINDFARMIALVTHRFRLTGAMIEGSADASSLSHGKQPSTGHAKARHRWSQEISTVDFHIHHQGVRARVRWVARNRMVIFKGATMLAEAPLNKDGSIGFSVRFAQQLRLEHEGQFANFQTTQDILLKSVNEVGLFLYFGGTNSWLILKDDQGKTIHDWTVVTNVNN